MCEPLRGKKQQFVGHINGFVFSDIKSAVEGLKKAVEDKFKNVCSDDARPIIFLINKWFEDVIEQE